MRPGTALTDSPVVEFPAIGMEFGAASEAFPVDSVVDTLVFVSRSKTKVDKALIDISAAGGSEHSMGVFGILSDDVDDPIYGVRSPNGASRPPDDFNPVHIFEQRVLNLPINPGKQRRVNRSSIDEHEHRSR